MNVPTGRTFAVKLTLLITIVSGLTTALVCVLLVVLQARRMLDVAVETASAHARIIAANSTAALDFDDEEAARSTLGGLAAVPEFAAAQISTPDGRVFAQYERGAGEPIPSLDAGSPLRTRGRWLTLPQPIVRDREHIGTLVLLYDLAPARRRTMYDIGIAAGITGGAILLSFFAARRMQRSLLRPVRELSRVAGAIATADDFDIKARKYSDDELGVMTDVFNTMIDRIREGEVARRDHQAMLEREVARRTAEVLETQSRLRQSERMASLGTLSAGLGHDIGNILMPLRSHVSSLRDSTVLSGAEREGHFEAISRATEYLQNLSTGLRLLAQDPDQLSLRCEATRLPAWWRATGPLLRAMIGSRVDLEADLPDDLPAVRVSKSLLTQAVFNLVQNAAQAMTPEGGAPAPGARIRVWARAASDAGACRRIRLAVTDNGPGMDDTVRERCLEPYFTTKTRRISSGLGLPLVKGIAENVGGTLEVESSPGSGSTFSLVLPAETAHAGTKVCAVVSVREPRRRAVVAHLLTSLDCQVQFGPAGVRPADQPSPEASLWVTDSLEAVPGGWTGRVILFGGSPGSTPDAPAGVLAVDPSTPIAALRRMLQEFFLSEHGNEFARQ